MKNYLIIFSYKGTNFYGSQKQPGLNTVQNLFEDTLSKIYDEKIKFCLSSRLDRGVHAIFMGGNFKVKEEKINIHKLKYALNRLFPLYIQVIDIKEVGEDFSARYDSKSKTYLYRVHVGSSVDPFRSDLTYHPFFEIDFNKLNEALKLYIGKHDFKGFASSIEEKENTILIINSAYAEKVEDEIHIRFIGKSFLRYQVRYMVGIALEYSFGRCSLKEIEDRLKSGNQSGKRTKAPAEGLYLEYIDFDYERSKNV